MDRPDDGCPEPLLVSSLPTQHQSQGDSGKNMGVGLVTASDGRQSGGQHFWNTPGWEWGQRRPEHRAASRPSVHIPPKDTELLSGRSLPPQAEQGGRSSAKN